MTDGKIIATRGPVGLFAIGSAVAWVAVYAGSRAVLSNADLPDWARIIIALAPLVPFIAFLMAMIAGVQSMDELHRRVHLQALAFAFPSAIVVLMTLGLLQLAAPHFVSRFPFRDVWPILPLLYFCGLAWSWRRYQ